MRACHVLSQRFKMARDLFLAEQSVTTAARGRLESAPALPSAGRADFGHGLGCSASRLHELLRRALNSLARGLPVFPCDSASLCALRASLAEARAIMITPPTHTAAHLAVVTRPLRLGSCTRRVSPRPFSFSVASTCTGSLSTARGCRFQLAPTMRPST